MSLENIASGVIMTKDDSVDIRNNIEIARACIATQRSQIRNLKQLILVNRRRISCFPVSKKYEPLTIDKDREM